MTDTDREAVQEFIQDVLKDHILSEGMTRNEEDTADTYKIVDLLRALLDAREAAEAENVHLRAVVESYEEMAEASRKAGGPGVLRRRLEQRRLQVRAEAAEAKLAAPTCPLFCPLQTILILFPKT